MKTLNEAKAWLASLLKFGIKPGLERMEWLLERLDHPERRIKTVHIAGTNGKGSTVQFLSQILLEAGHEVGTFTSPHISDVTDRIAVNGIPISSDEFVKLANDIRPLVEELSETEYGQATEFEVITVMAIQYFATVSFPDLVLLEVGLGGRLDSTNVVHPLVSVITNISKDHTDVLGESIEEIAQEKAGIIKSGVPVITAASGKALDVIEEKARAKRTKFYRLNHEFRYLNEKSDADGEQFDFESVFSQKQSLRIRMKGTHQVQNASLALMAVDYLYFFYGLHIEFEHVKAGLEKALIRSRFEQIMETPAIFFDGAHNPAAAEQLAKTIAGRFPNRHIHIVFAALERKDAKNMIKPLEEVADEITFTTFSHDHANRADRFKMLSTTENARVIEDPKIAFERALSKAHADTVIVITGSLYFISELRRLVL